MREQVREQPRDLDGLRPAVSLGAAMWCEQHGLSAVRHPDDAAYLGGGLRVLRTDARALVTVAGKAQAAVDYLNGCAGVSTSDVGTGERAE